MSTGVEAGKGALLEEVLRSYFLKSGFYVVRGVPFRLAQDDATDVDLWLYERPTGSSRRVQICDIKYKQRPKAVERILWTSGLARALKIDGAYVATTDKRPALQALAKRLDVTLIDGNDINRIQASQAIGVSDRISDEQLLEKIRKVEAVALTRRLQDARSDILSALSDGFGGSSAVRALEAFANLSDLSVKSHPDSEQAQMAARLAYLAASILCVSLDYVSVQGALRPIEERRLLVLDAIRLGALASVEGKRSLELALALVEKYSPAGRSAAQVVERGLQADLDQIPAEVVADQATRLIKADQMFGVAKELEAACYTTAFISFDALTLPAKSMVAALLDYSDIDRVAFSRVASSTSDQGPSSHTAEAAAGERTGLFSDPIQDASQPQSVRPKRKRS